MILIQAINTPLVRILNWSLGHTNYYIQGQIFEQKLGWAIVHVWWKQVYIATQANQKAVLVLSIASMQNMLLLGGSLWTCMHPPEKFSNQARAWILKIDAMRT